MNQTLTPWFPIGTKPLPNRPGVYFTRYPMTDPFFRAFKSPPEGYTYWNGKKWGWMAPTVELALRADCRGVSPAQNKEWRGLARNPEEAV